MSCKVKIPIFLFALVGFLPLSDQQFVGRKIEIFKSELFLDDGGLNVGLYDGFVKGRRRFGGSQIPHGVGRINYFNNDAYGRKNYTGNWKNGFRSGNGTTFFRDGSVHAGNYEKGLEEKIGTIRYQNGTAINGEFQDGKLHGHAVIKYPNGEQREGFFASDILSGQVIYTKSNGETVIEMWRNGAIHNSNNQNSTRTSEEISEKTKDNKEEVIITTTTMTTTTTTNKSSLSKSDENSRKTDFFIMNSRSEESSNPQDSTKRFAHKNSNKQDREFSSNSVFDDRKDSFPLPSSKDFPTKKIKEAMMNLRRMVHQDDKSFLKAVFEHVNVRRR